MNIFCDPVYPAGTGPVGMKRAGFENHSANPDRVLKFTLSDSGRRFMGKHARKRQRKDRPTQESAVPLGTKPLLDSDVNKDDDERRLESLLFGKPFVARRGNNVAVIDSPEVEDEGVDVIAAELEGLLDSDVSYRWDSLVVF